MQSDLLSRDSPSTRIRFHVFGVSFVFWFAMNVNVHKRLAYLTQISEILAKSDNLSAIRLSSYHGYVAREICLKNQVRSFGWENFKRRRCKRCFAFFVDPTTCSFKVTKKHFAVKCKECGLVKKVKVSAQRKTHYEKLIYQTPTSSNPSCDVETKVVGEK